ncbi:MAG: hypothetical protein N3E38_00405 [Candidatus Aenigmarchaeota archaeon]|nr:hypothetical protein [Candidatus Aenigmarchaeota archaeon]MCX8179188.1 hypothetical protein [Candidatus Aenigmarchaeota archaeon]MDW8149540.1 MBL fold metallo-hydrolase RNA specificity domain-containing protein [Candidatus Aenigmarchaeota archaeon]
MSLKIFYNQGVGIEFEGKRILLDPEIETKTDLIFVSHAHFDHIQNIESVTPKISSLATKDLIEHRTGVEIINPINFDYFNFGKLILKQLNSGHIVGSTSLLMEAKNKKIFYTGDICDRHRFNLKAAVVPKSDIMILESTFGKEEYLFPPVVEVIEKSINWIVEQMESGYSVALLGYPLGKAQIITKISEIFNIPIIVFDTIFEINEICRKHGFELRTQLQYSKYTDFIKNEKFITIFPNSVKYVNFLKSMRTKTPIKIAAFSGWAIDENYKQQMNVDETFPLSDHADFNGLLKLVKQSDPEIVYTVHGFKENLAKTIAERLGINAVPLNDGDSFSFL